MCKGDDNYWNALIHVCTWYFNGVYILDVCYVKELSLGHYFCTDQHNMVEDASCATIDTHVANYISPSVRVPGMGGRSSLARESLANALMTICLLWLLWPPWQLTILGLLSLYPRPHMVLCKVDETCWIISKYRSEKNQRYIFFYTKHFSVNSFIRIVFS